MNSKQIYTIQETANLTGLPESTLRYYETIGIIPSIKRDFNSKHRIYNENDIDVIVTVSCLSATGMSIDDMRSYLKSAIKKGNSTDTQIKLLKTQAKKLIEEEASIKLRQKYVAVKIAYWQTVKEGNPQNIEKIKKQAIEIAKELKQLKGKEGNK